MENNNNPEQNGDNVPKQNGVRLPDSNMYDVTQQHCSGDTLREGVVTTAPTFISTSQNIRDLASHSGGTPAAETDGNTLPAGTTVNPDHLEQNFPTHNAFPQQTQQPSPDGNRAPYPVLQYDVNGYHRKPASNSIEVFHSSAASQYGSISGTAPSPYGSMPASFPSTHGVSTITSPPRSSYGPFPGSQNSPPKTSAYGSFPGTQSYGAFPGSQSYGSFPGSTPRGPFSGLARPGEAWTSSSVHQVSSFGGFGGAGQPEHNEPAHLAPANPPKQVTDADRMDHYLREKYGEEEYTGNRSGVEGGESTSHLAGIWDHDARGGGRAHAQKAWRAKFANGGMYERDTEADEVRDPEISALFDSTDVDLFRKRGSPHNASRRGGWRRLLRGTTHENVGRRDPIPRPRGRGAGRPRGRSRKYVDPGREFKDYLTKANKAYVDNDLHGAADLARQAILANPEVFQAYSLLSEILTKLGDGHAAIEAMKLAASVAKTVDVWTMLADKILDHAGDNRTAAVLKEVLDCYSDALNLKGAMKEKPELEFELRAAKLEIYRELNDSRGSRFECRHILAKFPEKTEFCQEYASLCAAWNDKNEIAKAKEAYEKAFEIYKDNDEFGDPNDPTDRFTHLHVYLELVEMLGGHEDGLKRGKQFARWILGRKHETYWDKYTEDDCEFDVQNYRRRNLVEWQQGRASLDSSKYGEGLPVEVKVRMGLIRLKMGVHHYQEAIKHFQPLLQYADAIAEYYDLFKAVAMALREGSFFQAAAEYFDPLRIMPDASDPEKIEPQVWLHFGVCYEVLKRPQDAISCFEIVASQHRGDTYPKACAKLAKLYEDSDEIDKARFLVNEVIKLNRRDLLYDARLKMVPVLDPTSIRKPLPFEVRYAVPKPRKSPSPTPAESARPLREIRPAGAQWPPLSTEATFAASLADKERARLRAELGWDHTDASRSSVPLDQQDVMSISRSPTALSPEGPEGTPQVQGLTQTDIELPKTKKRQRGKKGKSALAMLCGDIAGEDTEYDDTATQPKTKRPRTKKDETMSRAAQEHAKRYQHISDANARAFANLEACQALRQALKDGSDETAVAEWVAAARSLLDLFTSMKVFFPHGTAAFKTSESDDAYELNSRKIRADVTGPQEFLGIAFSEWHRVFVDLTLYYASNGEQVRCYQMLQGVLFAATPFQKTESEWVNYATGIQCGLAFNDSQYLIEIARKIAAESDNRSPMAAQLFAALNRFTYGSNWFAAGPTQKWMLRLVKMFDFVAMAPEQRTQMDWSNQGKNLVNRVDEFDRDPNKPTEPDLQILMTYGHMVSQANFSHSSIPYYYRALALQPDNICVNLSIAAMWVQNSMKRQTENRQFGITEGLSFLNRYYDLRVASGKACHLQEAEYNRARMWHCLGLNHLALPAYEKVLALSPRVQSERDEDDGSLDQDVEDFAAEAAFALQGIYSLAGNLEAAQALTEEWLVF